VRTPPSPPGSAPTSACSTSTARPAGPPWAGIEAEHGPLPGTITSITTRGCHLFYRWTPGLGIGAGRYGAGLDHRGDGGYVVLPPSVHPSGHVYRWLTADDSAPTPWAHPLPAWPVHALPVERPQRPAAGVVVPFSQPAPRGPFALLSGGHGGLDGLARTVREAPQGQRNHTLNWAAYKAGQDVRAGRLDVAAVVTALAGAARDAGLGDVEVEATIRSGIAAGLRGEVA
jgi:Bifunctional DNA primase/polymerase, N-terminal